MHEPHLLIRSGRLAKSPDRLKKLVSILLLPIGAIYGIIGRVRRGLYEKNWLRRYQSVLPTIGIGNLAVGGTGKTPMVEYLVRLLKDDRKVAVLSRGYKRKTKGYLDSFSEREVTAETFGDEPTQLHEKFPDIQVVVCEKRTIALQHLERTAQRPDLVLLDDAYQHLHVRCHLNLLLTDFSRLYCDDFPMPAGRLREFPSASAAADAVIVTKSPSSLNWDEAEKIRTKLGRNPDQPCFFTTLAYDEITPVTPIAKQISLTPNTLVILLTGIANPQPLQQEISKQFSDIETISYNDHHSFSLREIEALCKKIAEKGEHAVIITTEKDAVRLRARHVRNLADTLPVFVLPVRMAFLFGEEERFNRMIREV